jgi:hypothetical protein
LSHDKQFLGKSIFGHRSHPTAALAPAPVGINLVQPAQEMYAFKHSTIVLMLGRFWGQKMPPPQPATILSWKQMGENISPCHPLADHRTPAALRRNRNSPPKKKEVAQMQGGY